jgi:SAM-dependent methyltransferase
MTTEEQAQFKEMVRSQWTTAAEAWAVSHDTFAEASKDVTVALADAANLKPGQRVLDLAGGTGEPSLTVAERVSPGGTVVCTDLVPGMLAAAEANAKKRGLTNMTFELADMEQLQFPDDSFDRVTSRFGIMFPPDTQKALGEIRRVLKPGGQVTFVVWAPAAENPFFMAMNAPLAAAGLLAPPPPGAPTPFRFAEPGSLRAAMNEAGFRNTEEDVHNVGWSFPSTAEEQIEFTKMTLPNIRKALEEAPPSVVEEVIASMNKHYDGERLNYGAKIYVATAAK